MFTGSSPDAARPQIVSSRSSQDPVERAQHVYDIAQDGAGEGRYRHMFEIPGGLKVPYIVKPEPDTLSQALNPKPLATGVH